MCGICGFFNINNFAGNCLDNNDTIRNMLKAIEHRGPDGCDSFLNYEVAFGFCRLSFIDISGGMQPISNEDDSIYMICNGEIYNHRELRTYLQNKGHQFKTKTDVEVIIHLYEEYGINFISKLNGQFAIALYDWKKHQLLLIRDQFGIAPLFFTYKNGRLIFASEIKAILQYPDIDRKINPVAVDQVLNFPGIVAPTTFFRGIYALEPGHMLVSNTTGITKNIEYWDLIYDVDNEDLGEEFYEEKCKELLIDAIRKRLLADVPIGFYISGGLDSSIVACFIDKFISDKHSSFSAEVISKDHNEEKYQKIIQDHIKSEHYSVQIRYEDLWKELPNVVYYAESAIRESYDVAAFLLSKLVSTTDVKAVLTGQGADEFFNGYVGYSADLFRKMKKNCISVEEANINERLWGDPYFRYERNHHELQQQNYKLYSDDLKGSFKSFSAIEKSPIDLDKVKGLETRRRRSYIDYKLRLADHLLGDHGDRMVFAHSIEGRHPFLDINFIEFVIKIPEKYKLRGVNEKYILKKIANGIVPKEIINRKKFPFSTPGMTYMLKENPEMREMYLSKSLIRKHGIFDWKVVEEMIEKYLDPNFNIEGQFYLDYLQVVLTTSLLCEQYHLTL